MASIRNGERGSSVREKLNATGLPRRYRSPQHMLSARDSIVENEEIISGRFFYVGAGPDAEDHHLTNAAGSKIYILPQSVGVWDLAAWGVDTTGETDEIAAIRKAVSVALASSNSCVLRIPGGTIKFSDQVRGTLARGQTFSLIGEGATTLDMTGLGMRFTAETAIVSSLSSRVAPGDNVCALVDTAGIEVGDLVTFYSKETIETGWGYPKNDVRRVVAKSGNSITVNKPFRWTHSPDDLEHVVTASAPASVDIKGVKFLSAASSIGGSSVTLNRMTGGRISSCDFIGDTATWASGIFSDSLILAWCCGVDVSANITNARYSPSITACISCRFHDSTMICVRHADLNYWSEDCIIENITGIATNGLVQSHPNTGGVFRNITDAGVDALLVGYDLRGLGETVENCRVLGAATPSSVNTCAPLLKSEYLDIAANYIRRISDFNAPNATIALGKDGWNVFERCRVYEIRQNRYEADHTQLSVDALTTFTKQEY